MKPLYFGTSKKPLFGIYQPPQNQGAGHGVVLCYPIGHEYVVAYPAFRQLASGLTQAGFHVLRFDFFGSGDSAGEAGEGDLAQWRQDLEHAIEELKDTSGAERLSLAGLRLGGSIAASVAAGRDDIESVVLWEPVVRGTEYVAELESTERNYLRRILPRPKAAIRNTPHLEVMGYPISDQLRDDIATIDLLGLERRIAQTVLVVDRPGCACGEELAAGCGPELAHLQIDAPKIWSRDGGLEESLIPFDVVRGIVEWMKGQ